MILIRIKCIVEHIGVLAQLVMFNNQDLHYMFAYSTDSLYDCLLHTSLTKKIPCYIWNSADAMIF
jgi:hypothetical protein